MIVTIPQVKSYFETGDIPTEQQFINTIDTLAATTPSIWGLITGTLSSQTDLQTALNLKQATLVSGTNIKTINGASILGAGDITVLTGTTGWSVLGNTGTIDGTNFIGTTDNIPFSIRVNNERSGRIDNALNNTFYGYQSGNAITTGLNNTCIGSISGRFIESAIGNTSLGYNSLSANVSGNTNTAIGGATLVNCTVADNSALGYGALGLTTTGTGNTAVGRAAGNANTIGSDNTLVGKDADVGSAGLNNATAIGANSSVSQSDCMVLGDIGVRVSIGVSAAHASAILDLTTTSHGFLPPRMATASKTAILSPATGLIVYDTDLNKICVWTGAAWETVTSAP